MMASFEGVQMGWKVKYVLMSPGVCLMTQVLVSWGICAVAGSTKTKQWQSYLFHKGGYQLALSTNDFPKAAIIVLMYEMSFLTNSQLQRQHYGHIQRRWDVTFGEHFCGQASYDSVDKLYKHTM